MTVTISPTMIKINPTTFPIVKVSPNNHIPKRNTMAGARLIKGYASVIWNLVMAAIQHKEAIKADKNPDNMNGSMTNRNNAINLSTIPESGSVNPNFMILHFRIICP